MTITELAKIRRIRAKPALPILLTDNEWAWDWGIVNDWPTMWIPALHECDLSPLYKLDVFAVLNDQRNAKDILTGVREHEANVLKVVGIYGFAQKLIEAGNANH